MTRSLGVRPLGLSHRPASTPAAHTSASLSLVAEVLSECRLLAYISQVPTQMSFLFRLINIIHVQTLTQVRGPADLPQGRGDWKQLPSSQSHLHPRSVGLAKKFVWLMNTFNKVLGENEKCVFLLKTEQTFGPTQYIS